MNHPVFVRRKFRQETFFHSFLVRPLAQEIVGLVWNTPITPNQLTAFRVILNIAALVFFIRTEFVTGFILFQIHEVVDHADGMLARMKNIRSEIGATLEVVSDTLFSSAFGFLGMAFATAGYLLEGSAIYFVLYGFIAMSYCYGSYFSKLLKKDLTADIHMDHDGQTYLPLIGPSIKTTLVNWIKTAYTWQNQFLLFGGLLYFPMQRHGVNTLLIGFVIVTALSQLYWLSSLKHFKNRIFAGSKGA